MSCFGALQDTRGGVWSVLASLCRVQCSGELHLELSTEKLQRSVEPWLASADITPVLVNHQDYVWLFHLTWDVVFKVLLLMPV